MFQHLLREDLIRIPIHASSCEGALAELIAMMPFGVFSSRDKSQLLEMLLQREFFESTLVQNQLSIPCGVLPGISEPYYALGISRKGMAYDSENGLPIHFIFLSVFPENSDPSFRHARVEEIQFFFKEPFLRERLKICETAEEVYEILMRESQPAFTAPRLKFRA